MSRHANDFREKSEQVEVTEPLQVGVWYRSPLWSDGHLLGAEREWANDGIAWCGRSLADAQAMEDTGEKNSLGGLWVDQRTSSGSQCATCRARQKEWDVAVDWSPTVY